MKIYPVKIECVDELQELVFTVETFDEACAVIALKQTLHSPESLENLVVALRKAFKMLDLNK
jgi:hypothetical protein